MYSGMLILSGLITFVIAEKIFSVIESVSRNSEESILQNDNSEKLNNNTKGIDSLCKTEEIQNKKHVSIYFPFCFLKT